MSAAVFAALDFGTSGVKVALIDTDGVTLAGAQAPYPTVSGRAGEREQDPSDWWAAGVAALRECPAAVRDRVVAVAATGQMQDLICVADSGGAGEVRRSPVRAALLYSDTRAGAQHTRLSNAFPDWARRTGNHQDSSNVGAKIAWLADTEPATLASSTSLLFSAAGYVLWRAGAEPACDLATASVTGLLDVGRREWFHAMVTASGATPAQLPRLVQHAASAESIVGTLTDAAAHEWGLPAGIPLVLALGDAAATTDGLVGSEPGDAYLYLGSTGWFAQIGATAADPSPRHSIVLPGWQRRLQIGAVLSAGTASAWALATFLPGLSFAEADALAGARLDSAPPARLLCLPGLNGERTPVRDNQARGAFIGITDQTDAVDLYLAVLTGVAMNLRHAADDMRADDMRADDMRADDTRADDRQPPPPRRLALVGGAAESPTWRRILASVFDVPVITGPHGDPGTVSAARHAADALGLAHSIRSLFDIAAGDETGAGFVTEPGPGTPLYRELLPVHRALYDALAGSFQSLAQI
ncbi:FGGY family carbohydrate kinase [Glaciibacter psychrotolerans]|uniref:Xylulokinase n=1 Tax=Glaciibacter psychrotolerans TaxID=670054 RepID=A0A7Z0J4Z6_9MICO|nr:FGGY family carbohydrate kinase [Leifsonia psychrotolerans]NYJ18349.1 xylulokinase [Leifsonia psychrotolerans]